MMTEKTNPSKIKGTEASPRVFLVVIDDSEELHQALYYACRRAVRLDGHVALMHCIPPAEFQHWAGVGELMREEAREEAESLLRVNSEYVHEITGKTPVVYLREGDPKTELIELINEASEITMLILGASTDGENSGPLISYMTNKGASVCRVPITIVPGNLSDEDIDHIT